MKGLRAKLIVLVTVIGLAFIGSPVFAQASPVGVWKTIDDETGQAKSHVQIWEQNGQLYGRILRLINPETPNPTCDCDGARSGKPIEGMTIMWGLTQDGSKWTGGKIFDPSKDATYDCEVWLEGGNLRLKGIHWTGLSRTQTWYRVQ